MTPDRRRPRFRKRWIALPLLILLAIGASWAIESAAVSFVRQAVESRIAGRIGAEITVGEIDLRWLPLELRVSDVTIVTDAEGPLLELGGATIEAGWRELLYEPRRLRAVLVDRPRISIRIEADGSTNLPRFERSGSGGAGVSIDRLVVSDGEATLGERRVPLDLSARGLRAWASGTPDGEFSGAVDAGDVVVGLPNGATYAGAVGVRGAWRDGELRLLRGRVGGPHLEATLADGIFRPATGEWRVDLDASGDVELLGHLGVDASRLAGDWRFGGTLASEGGWRLSGRLASPRLSWDDLTLARVSAALEADAAALRLDDLRGRFGGASLAGSVQVRLDAPERPVEVEVEASDGDLAALFGEVGLDLPRVSGGWAGRGAFAFEADDPEALRGGADFELRIDRPSGESLWERVVRLELGAGQVRFLTVGEASVGEMLSLTGRYSLADGVAEVDYRLGTERIGDWVALATDLDDDSGAFLPRAGVGTVTGRFHLSPAAWSSRMGLDLRSVRAGELEVEHLRGPLTISAGGVRDMRLDLTRPEGALQVAGRVGFAPEGGSADLDLRIDAVGWPADAVWRQLDLPLEVDGALTAWATVRGSVDAPVARFEGSVVPAAAPAAGDVSVEEPGPPRPEIRADGEVRLAADEAPAGIDLRLEAVRWPAHEILAIVDLPVELQGRLTASGELGGTTEALTGSFVGAVEEAVLADVPVDTVEARMELEPAGVRFDRLEVRMAAGRVAIAGWMPYEAEDMALTLESSPLDLAASPFVALLPEGVGGALRCDGELVGSLADPDLRLDLEAEELSMAGRPASSSTPSRLAVRLKGGRLTISGAVGDLLSIDGGGVLAEEATDLELGLRSDALGALAAWLLPEGAPAMEGGFSGVLRLAGRPGEEDLAPQLRLDQVTVDYAGRRLEALEPVVASYRDGVVEIQSLFLGNDETGSEIFLFGRMPLGEGEPLDLRMQLSVSTRWLELALPGYALEGGRVEGIATVEGTLARPEVRGQGEVRQRSLQLPGVPQRVEDLRAVLLFYPEQLVLDEMLARFAGGPLRAAGDVEPYAEDGPQYRFQLAGTGLQLQYPEGWQVRTDTELVLSSTPDGRQIRGQIQVSRATYSQDVPIGLIQLLQGAFARRPELVDETDEILATTQVNISVRGKGALRVDNNVADLTGDLDLVVRGSLARPVIFGTVRMEPGGTLLYSGNEYEVTRAELSFVNPYRVEPVIDLEATARLREYDVTLNLAGTVERLEVDFSSNPPLADLEVLALLTGGGQRGGATGSRDTGGVAESFLYGQAASVVAERVNRLFGLDKFRIDPLTGESGDLSSARVTVGERLSRDLFATYSYDPSQNKQQILQLEWQISRQLTLVATQNGDGSYALDARWEKSF